jgi:predicted DNA-binding WGR domain protein
MILFMDPEKEVYLERIDANRNMARYYRLSVVRTLLGDWSMIREWGRIGRRGGRREHWCGTADEASQLLGDHIAERRGRGYVQR